IADYIGRIRTLALSILIFSVFTALQGLAETPFQLGIFRFFAGVGTGAEIIVGIPLVAEAFAENNRARILGIMMTGGAVGTLLAVWTSNIWLPTIQRGILAGEGIQGNAAISYISFGMTMWSLGGIFGYAAFGFIADAIGRRPTIFLYNLGTLLVGLYLY